MCHRTLKTKYKKLYNYIYSNKDKEDDLEILLKAQDIFGYLSKDVQEYISKKLGITEARVRGLIKYNSLIQEPKGKYDIKVCLGTTCKSKGGEEILNELKRTLNINQGEVTNDNKFSIEATGCTHACTIAPLVNINGKIYSEISEDNVEDIISEYK